MPEQGKRGCSFARPYRLIVEGLWLSQCLTSCPESYFTAVRLLDAVQVSIRGIAQVIDQVLKADVEDCIFPWWLLELHVLVLPKVVGPPLEQPAVLCTCSSPYEHLRSRRVHELVAPHVDGDGTRQLSVPYLISHERNHSRRLRTGYLMRPAPVHRHQVDECKAIHHVAVQSPVQAVHRTAPPRKNDLRAYKRNLVGEPCEVASQFIPCIVVGRHARERIARPEQAPLGIAKGRRNGGAVSGAPIS